MRRPLEGRLSAGRRATLAALADLLIPASDAMPSASQAGVAGPLVDEVLRARPDLEAPLVALLDRSGALSPEDALAAARAEPEDFEVLGVVVAGGYLMDRRVRDLLAYPGQVARPVDPYDYVSTVEEGLLTPVIERGPIYRPTP